MAKNKEVTTKFNADISQFKDNIIQAKRTISEANAEFKNASASMDVFGKSSDGVAAQVEATRKKLNAQNEVLDNLKKQYAAVTAEQGENSEAAKRLATQITNQETAVLKTQKSLVGLENNLEKVSQAEKMAADNGLTVEQNLKALEQSEKKAEAEAVKLAAGLDDAGDSAKEAGEDASKGGEGFTVLKGVLANLATEAIKMAVDGLKNLGAEIVNTTKAAAAYADEINTMSTFTGISAEKLQEMRYMAELVDVSVETITGSMTKLEKTMYNAANGNKSATAAFQKLGVSVTDANGNLRDNEAVFADVIDALGRIDNETERDAVAMSVLGKSAKDLNPLILEGKDRIAELTAEAHEMGYVLDNEALDGLNSLNDTLDTLGTVGEGVKNQIGAMAAETLNGFLTPFVAQIAKIPETLKTGGIAGVVNLFSNMIKNIITEMQQNAPQIAQAGADLLIAVINGIISNAPILLSTALTIILTFAQYIGEALPDLIPAVVEMMLEIVEVLIDNVDLLIDAAIAIILGLADGLIKSLPKLLEKAPEIVLKLTKAIAENAPKLIDAAVQLITMLTDFLVDPQNSEMLINTTIQIIEILIMAFIENAPMLVEAAIKIMVALGTYFVEQAHLMAEKAPEIISKLADKFEEIKEKIKDIGKNIIKKVADGIKATIDDAKDWGKDMIDNFIKGIEIRAPKLNESVISYIAKPIADRLHFSVPEIGELSTANEWMPDFINLLTQGLESNKSKLVKAVSDVTGAVKSAFKPDFDALGDFTINPRPANGGAGIGGAQGGQTVNNYNYTQNISSPKPVSRLETYRQTKNLLSITKGALA